MPAWSALEAETAGENTDERNRLPGEGEGAKDAGVRRPDARARKTKEEKRREAEERNRISRATSSIRQKLTETEERITALEAKQREDELLLCDPEIYRDPERIRQLNQELKATAAELEDLYYQWNDLTLKIKSLEESPQR